MTKPVAPQEEVPGTLIPKLLGSAHDPESHGETVHKKGRRIALLPGARSGGTAPTRLA